MEAIEEQLASLTEALRRRIEARLRSAELGPNRWSVPKPRVCIMEPKRSVKILGWHSPQRWRQGFAKLNEIVLTPSAVAKGVMFAAEVLSHELVHLANAAAGRGDTSRQGRYHNVLYRETALAIGLKVQRNPTHGWCETRLGKDLSAFVRKQIRLGAVDPHVFRYRRAAQPKAAPSLVKLIADCGVSAYVPRGQVDREVLQCGRCGAVLHRAVS